mmetsp:Transcript_46867/g.60236  ORF Transcript_46867/g.60236 Transcript_46867/m.60236 type:complete len:237 (-) Transcript_46867:9-719(-)
MMCLKYLFFLISLHWCLGFDPYKLLSVDTKATGSEIKRAYRKKALQYHPDKCSGIDCEGGKFEEIAEAYEILSDKQKKSYYDDNQSGFDHSLYRQKSREKTNRGFHVFDDMFGDSSWQSWEPGDHIKTQFVRNGKLIKLEIFEDGSSTETETPISSHSKHHSQGGYSYTKKERNGMKQVHIQIDGFNFIEPLLLAFGISSDFARIISSVIGFFCSPLIMFIGIVYYCCWPRKRRET